MKKITILSGKGGVGKSSTTASLAVLLAKNHKIVAVDCDVDAPNLGLVLGIDEYESKERIQTTEKAEVIVETCPECKDKIDVCIFGAISWDEKNKRPIINRFLCEGCGACALAFPKGTVKLKKVQNATINTAKTRYGFPIISGHLKMGESGSGKIIVAVKKKAEKIAKQENAEIMLTDSSPGIGCPVIASIQDSDYIVAITEPTPSALNDLQRVLRVVKHFNIPYGIIINKHDINADFSNKIEKFADNQGISILAKFPYDRSFVDALVNLTPLILHNKKFESIFNNLLENIDKDLDKYRL